MGQRIDIFNICLVLLLVIVCAIAVFLTIRMKRAKAVPLVAAGLLVLTGVAFYLYEVDCTVTSITIELGEQVQTNPTEYLTGFSFAVKNSYVDDSQVSYGEVGEYSVRVKHFIQYFDIPVTIQDTTAPQFQLNTDHLYLKKDSRDSVDAKTLIASEFDLSGEIRYSLDCVPTTNVLGDQSVLVIGTDPSGNASQKELVITVDTAPVIEGVVPFYVAVSNEPDFCEGIVAMDDVDGDLSRDVVLHTESLNLEAPGEYTISYEVKDQYGLDTVADTVVYVYEPNDLQKLIVTHQINRREHRIIGAPNLYDGGIYEVETIEQILTCIEPAIVELVIYRSDGQWASKGSGFIYEIRDDNIYICTNNHVVHNKDRISVYLEDNVRAEGTVIAKGGKACSETDIAFVKVPLSAIPEETERKLQSIHLDFELFDSLGETEPIEIAYKCREFDNTFWYSRTGKMLEKSSHYPNDDGGKTYGTLMHVDLKERHGVSGSAIVSKNGTLVSMCVATFGSNNFYGIRPDKIKQFYEEKVLAKEAEEQAS